MRAAFALSVLAWIYQKQTSGSRKSLGTRSPSFPTRKRRLFADTMSCILEPARKGRISLGQLNFFSIPTASFAG